MNKQQQPRVKNQLLAEAMANITIADISARKPAVVPPKSLHIDMAEVGSYSTQPKSNPSPAARINPYLDGYKAPPVQLTRWQRLKQTVRATITKVKAYFGKKK